MLKHWEAMSDEALALAAKQAEEKAFSVLVERLLPRLRADDPITAEDIARLGEGGLCLNCEVCHWPNCGFGHC